MSVHIVEGFPVFDRVYSRCPGELFEGWVQEDFVGLFDVGGFSRSKLVGREKLLADCYMPFRADGWIGESPHFGWEGHVWDATLVNVLELVPSPANAFLFPYSLHVKKDSVRFVPRESWKGIRAEIDRAMRENSVPLSEALLCEAVNLLLRKRGSESVGEDGGSVLGLGDGVVGEGLPYDVLETSLFSALGIGVMEGMSESGCGTLINFARVLNKSGIGVVK